MGIADSRLRARRWVSPAPSIRPVPAPSVEAPPAQPGRRRRAVRVALAVAGVLVLAALGAAIAFVTTRDEREASPTTAAVAGTATVRRTTTHAPATMATHATRATRTSRTTKRATTTGFVPARVFAWPALAGADRYEIRFYRGPRLILRERAQRPRFALPQALHLRPGRYRWIVLPHVRGALGSAVVDSRFSVSG
jgi:hypothetical protein